MDKYVAVVFDDEEKTYGGASALRELHDSGDIVVYAAGVIAKDQDGAVSIKQVADEGPIGTPFGMLLGALVGVIGGPAGVAIGGATGGLIGFARDVYVAGMDSDLLDAMSQELTPGKCAVIAEITEGWTTPLDTKMAAAGGRVFRRSKIAVRDEQLARQAEADEKEWAELKAEWHEAVGEAKESVKKSVDKAEARLKETRKNVDDRLHEIKEDSDARVAALKQQIENAKGSAKKKFENRKAEIEADYAERSGKLKEAGSLISDALAA